MVWEMFRLIRRSYRLLSAALVVAAAAWMWSPSIAPRIDVIADFASRYLGVWTESACARNKEACLMAKQAQLNALHTSLSSAVNALAERKGKVSRDAGDRERNLAGNIVLLEEGRQIYARSVALKTVHFDGREYPPDALKQRLEALNEQTASLQASVRQARELNEAVDRKLKSLLIKKELVRAARDLLPPLIELVQATNAFGDIDAVLRDLTKLSDAAESMLTEVKDIDGWLSTTREIIRRNSEAIQTAKRPILKNG